MFELVLHAVDSRIELCCGINRSEGRFRRNQTSKSSERRFTNVSNVIDINDSFFYAAHTLHAHHRNVADGTKIDIIKRSVARNRYTESICQINGNGRKVEKASIGLNE